tara:strand:+ start:345 stop:881 length:537 start_codon:yes stop_codon:yes gene_type:complete
MNNFDIPFNKGLVGGRMKDEDTGLFFPWYTRSFLKVLNTWDVKKWRVFEYGSGDSTKWWKSKSSEVISVDNNKTWCDKTGAHFSQDKKEFTTYPEKFVKDGKFDCIIIDGNPNEWRDYCTEIAVECIKEGGILIIDNYNQASTKTGSYPLSDAILVNKEKFVFHQKGHRDWKTAYWVI